MYIITSLPGTCGDIIAAVIDTIDMQINAENAYLCFAEGRDLLTKELPKDGNIAELIDASPYLALETKFHKPKIEPDNSKPKKYFYITVDVSSDRASSWVFNRLTTLWPGNTMTIHNLKNCSIINNYYADFSIPLEDILEGRLIDRLKEIIDTPLDDKLYQTWLTLLMADYPFD